MTDERVPASSVSKVYLLPRALKAASLTFCGERKGSALVAVTSIFKQRAVADEHGRTKGNPSLDCCRNNVAKSV